MTKTLLCVVFVLTCSYRSVFDDYVRVLSPAIIEVIVSIDRVEGIPVDQATLVKVRQDAVALKILNLSMIAATGQNLSTACTALNQGISVFAADVPPLESLSAIKDPVRLAEIAAGITLIQGAMISIESPVAACQTSPSFARRALVTGAVKIQNPRDFAAAFNKQNLGKKLHVRFF